MPPKARRPRSRGARGTVGTTAAADAGASSSASATRGATAGEAACDTSGAVSVLALGCVSSSSTFAKVGCTARGAAAADASGDGIGSAVGIAAKCRRARRVVRPRACDWMRIAATTSACRRGVAAANTCMHVGHTSVSPPRFASKCTAPMHCGHAVTNHSVVRGRMPPKARRPRSRGARGTVGTTAAADAGASSSASATRGATAGEAAVAAEAESVESAPP